MPAALRQDVRYAVRLLVKERGFTVVVLLILALSIGSTVAMFSLVEAALLRRLPFPNANRVVAIWESNPTAKLDRFPVSGPNFLDWREQSTSAFDVIAAFETREANLSGSGDPQRVVITSASPSLLGVLGIRPAIGRAFNRDEENPGSTPVAILSEEYWRTHFGASANVIGRSVRIDGIDHTIIGVAPRGTAFPSGTALYTALQRGVPFDADQRGSHGLNVVAHLRDGVTIERAQRVMATLADRLAAAHPGSNRGWTVRLLSLRDELVGDTRMALVAAFSAVIALLAIGCANIANLLSARATTRRKEVLVRVALGADRRRIVQQLLTESVTLALAGGCLGIAVAWWGIRLIAPWAPQIVAADSTAIGISIPVVAFAFAVSVLTGILFGLTPALSGGRMDTAQALRESSRGLTESRRLRRVRSVLTACQVALSVALLSTAGLLMKSFARLQHEDVGFHTSGRVAMDLAPAGPAYESDSMRARAYREIITRVAAVPGVASAALVRTLPLEPELTALNSFGVEGRADLTGQRLPSAYQRPITPRYLEIMGIPLLRGRMLSAGDDERAPLVAIIDSAAAEKFWPGVDPIGRRLYYDRREGRLWVTIVGVAGSVRHRLTSKQDEPTVYVPVLQWPMSQMTIVVQTALSPSAVVGPVSRAIRSFDPELPIANPRTLDRIASDAMWRPRFSAVLTEAFAVAALLLAALGIYGMMSYTVSQRRGEMALRMALGARQAGVAQIILKRSVFLGGTGVVVGLIVAAAAARAISGLLYGVSSFDVEVFSSVAAVLIVVSVLAALWPAYRASRVPLGEVLRSN